VKTGVNHIYCFEINDDSIQALRRNIEQNGVEDICEVSILVELDMQIIPGDNRVTTQPYWNLADRVLLGLLPSSREGWPLAMQMLKKEGGILHVHENVHDSEYESFVQSLPKELEQLGEQKGKKYHCEISHIERVKSYAPKVYHYVFDVKCNAIE
jgi:tRNA wybutosine-synthesizing protein 2/3/4